MTLKISTPNGPISLDQQVFCKSMDLQLVNDGNSQEYIQLKDNISFPFLMPLSESDFKKNQGLSCQGRPEIKLATIDSNKTEFVSGGAFLVQLTKVHLNDESPLKERVWIREGDYVLIELRGPFRQAVAFWNQDAVIDQILNHNRPKVVPFEPTQEDFAFLNDLHIMTMHQIKR